MYVSTTIHGAGANEGSKVVWKRDCEMYASPPGDPLLSDPVVLNVLEDLAKRSLFSSYVRSRKEHGGYLLEKDGQVQFEEWTYGQGMPTTCSSDHLDERADYISRGYRVLAEFHTHPSGTTEVIDPRGGVCPKYERYSEYTLRDGPSGRGQPDRGARQGDLDPWETGANEGIVGYVVDPLHVHRWERVNHPDGTWRIAESSFGLNRTNSRCIR
jgi:hypothetical protein